MDNSFSLEAFLNESPASDSQLANITGFLGEDETPKSQTEAWHEPGYDGNIDYRIRQLSYSSILTLHTCPRKLELYKRRSTRRTEETVRASVTFAFGHTVGTGIASVFEGVPEDEIIFNAFVGWATSPENRDEKSSKSLYSAIFAIQKLISMRKSGFLKDYELVWYEGKPATELSFVINLPDGFRYRGHVDAVLRHKVTGEILVLECKTTGAKTLNPATYKNSAQAIGYSIVLDVIYPEISSYEVLYLVYQSSTLEFTPIPFHKTYLQRAIWIRELMMDIESIKMYESEGLYPTHGESCFQYYKEVEELIGGVSIMTRQGECEYLNICNLSTAHLTKPCTEEEEDKTEYQVSVSLMDLLETQLKKAEVV